MQLNVAVVKHCAAGNKELNWILVINSNEQLVGCGSFVRGKPNIMIDRQQFSEEEIRAD